MVLKRVPGAGVVAVGQTIMAATKSYYQTIIFSD